MNNLPLSIENIVGFWLNLFDFLKTKINIMNMEAKLSYPAQTKRHHFQLQRFKTS
jgi:hypothetical protein